MKVRTEISLNAGRSWITIRGPRALQMAALWIVYVGASSLGLENRVFRKIPRRASKKKMANPKASH